MPAFNHPYFGLLDSDAIEDDVDVLWESEADVAGRSVEIQIWALKPMPLSSTSLPSACKTWPNSTAAPAPRWCSICKTMANTLACTAKKWTAATRCPPSLPPLPLP